MKVLFTTPVLERPPVGGPQLRIENSLKALAKVSDLHIVSRVDREALGGIEGEIFYRSISKEFVYSPTAQMNNYFLKRKSKLYFASRVLSKLSKLAIGNTFADALFIVNYSRANNIKVIWCGYGNISYPLMKKIKQMAPELKVVCDTDSVWSRFVLREIPFEKNPSVRKGIIKRGLHKLNEEFNWVDFCDVTTAVSQVDLDYYKSITAYPDRVRLFSNVIDLKNYEKNVQAPEGHQTPSIYLAGSFGPGSSMDKAARWVINEIFPSLVQKYPGLHFYIIGNGSKETLADIIHEKIIITGRLDSVLPYLANASIAIVPLMFESGTRFKIMEAAACEVPIVSTTLGAEGIPVEHNKNILIADTSDEFIKAIDRIISNPSFGKELAKNCKNLIEKYNSVDSHAREAEDILSFLLSKGDL